MTKPVNDQSIPCFPAGLGLETGASVPIMPGGAHVSNMGESTPMVSLRNWPARIIDWMTDRGLLAGWPADATPKPGSAASR